MHQNSLDLMTYFRDKYLYDGATVLDVGAKRWKNQPSYRRILEPMCNYTGMDIEDGKNVDVVGYENLNGAWDVVISGQTMEHVRQPWEWLKNLTKFFSKYICIIAPNTCGEHRYPIDTYRYFPDGMRDLFEYAGIKELEIFKSDTDTIGIGAKSL